MPKNDIYSELYEKAKCGDTFTDLKHLVISQENILLAYRNIKNNRAVQLQTLINLQSMTLEI